MYIVFGLLLSVVPAYAASATPSVPEFFTSLVPFALMGVVMYMLIIRPQSKKAKAHQDMLAALRRGDRVLTAGGILGTVTKIDNDFEAHIEIADGVVVRVAKATITQVLAKPEPMTVVEKSKKK